MIFIYVWHLKITTYVNINLLLYANKTAYANITGSRVRVSGRVLKKRITPVYYMIHMCIMLTLLGLRGMLTKQLMLTLLGLGLG